jgi:DNA-binding response OmpR family regulator
LIRYTDEVKILICDDNTLVAEVLESVLNSDHRVTVTYAGEELLKEIRAESFDAVICDLALPDIPGHLLYRRAVELRNELADRFLFVTGGACSHDAMRFLETQRRPIIVKPFTAETLKRAVHALIAPAL